jgi:glycosyltransferase involved in cell wall biosynthesis
VVASEGSQARGVLHPTRAIPDVIDETSRRGAWDAHRSAIRHVLRRIAVDVVHMHGADFIHYLPPAEVPTLVSLHLPLSAYPPGILGLRRRGIAFNCVSQAQRAAGGPAWQDIPVIERGVATSDRTVGRIKRRYVVALGRVCPEKAFHHAIMAARAAGIPIVIGGRVFAHREHLEYFQTEIAPRLDRRARFVGPLTGRRKQHLLESARCLVVPSVADEASSLAAMEALAAGTPVVARPVGALNEIVEDGKTGFLVEGIAQMAQAIERCRDLDPAVCREAARARFSSYRMVGEYLAQYGRVREQPPSR